MLKDIMSTTLLLTITSCIIKGVILIPTILKDIISIILLLLITSYILKGINSFKVLLNII